MNQGTSSASPTDSPMKRRRGRPRKDESQSSPRQTIPFILPGVGAGASKSTTNIQSKGKDSIEDVNDDDVHIYDEMVGQPVTGVLEYAFEAGYFLTVRVRDSNVFMRGVVFKEGCVVPVTPENDIAPNIKMIKRGVFPIPPMKSSLNVPSSLNPTENNENRQQQKLPVKSFIQEDQPLLQKGQSDDKEQQEKVSDDKEQQAKVSDDKEQQAKVSDDKEQQAKVSDDNEQQPEKLSDNKDLQEKLSNDKELVENLTDNKEAKLSVGDEIREVGSVIAEGLNDSAEPPMKLQKTDQMTSSLPDNKQTTIQGNAVVDDSAELKSDDAVNDTDVLKDSTLAVPTVVEQENCGNFGFQISMEDGDNEDEASVPPGELVSSMETD